jgi:hypothetical protein
LSSTEKTSFSIYWAKLNSPTDNFCKTKNTTKFQTIKKFQHYFHTWTIQQKIIGMNPLKLSLTSHLSTLNHVPSFIWPSYPPKCFQPIAIRLTVWLKLSSFSCWITSRWIPASGMSTSPSWSPNGYHWPTSWPKYSWATLVTFLSTLFFPQIHSKMTLYPSFSSLINFLLLKTFFARLIDM